MPLSPEVRRQRWADFVERALDHARAHKGWGVGQVLSASGIGKATLSRWRNKQWERDLEPSLVERFCDAVGMPAAEAFGVLWPGEYGKRKATEAPPLDPDIEIIMRALNDPSTPEVDRIVIQQTVQMLADRLGRPGRRRRDAS